MFEALIRQAQQFGLGDKAQDLLGALLATIFDERSGGIAGLSARFRQQGLGERFDSWLGSAQPAPIEPQQLDHALGPAVLSGIAERLGIARGTALAAAAAVLPKLIAELTPNGQLPSGIPAGVGAYLGRPDRVGGANVPPAAPMRSASGAGWLKWVVLVLLILALGWCMLNQPPEPPPPTGTQQPAR